MRRVPMLAMTGAVLLVACGEYAAVVDRPPVDGPPVDDGMVDGDVDAAPVPEGFVLVPPGTFAMGSPVGEPGRGDEPVHMVTLTRGFYLQATEVTQGQWRLLMRNNPSQSRKCDDDDCPVATVNWWEALAYANALSDREDLPKCYDLVGCVGNPGQNMGCDSVTVSADDAGGNPYNCSGYRVPTEAEWEYAYRAGTTTAFYNGGITHTNCDVDSNLDAIGWYCGNAGGNAHPVAQKAPNAWGLYDMSGNLYEWCWDWQGSPDSGAVTDPTGPGSGSYPVSRGGAWIDHAVYARAAYRANNFDRRWRANYLGFRLARTLPSAERLHR